MTTILDEMARWVEILITGMGLPGLALVMFLETIFPPIPSEIIMPLAGYTAAKGAFSLGGAVAAGTAGALVGALALYAAGSALTEQRLRGIWQRLERWHISPISDLERAMAFFARRGEVVVFFGRLVALVRSLVSIPAGMARMPVGRFVLFTAAGTLLWNLLLGGAGYLLGENWEEILIWLAVWEEIVLVAAGVLLAAFIIHRVRKARRRLYS